ncbi:MAG: RNA polymerase sigma factor [Verrucomicrobiales bacterium]
MDSDLELLRRFAATGDGAAFTELVVRHAPMVRGVAWRRTQDWAVVDEVAQNVFAVLARKAGSVSGGQLAGWLHHAAVLECRNASRKASRYQAALRQYSEHVMNEPSHMNSAATWEELRPHLDEVLARLPAESRNLVVMRHLERRPIADIAAATGKSAEACRKSLQRALRRMETSLRRRGVAFSGSSAPLTALLAVQSLCAPPASAEALAATALQAAPTLSTTALSLPLLNLMNTTTIAKIAAVVAVLTAIPITLLWRENNALKKAAKRAQAPSNTISPLRRIAPTEAELEGNAAPLPSAPVRNSTARVMNHDEAAIAAFRKKAESKIKRLADVEFTAFPSVCPT